MAVPTFDLQGGLYHEYAQEAEYEFHEGLAVIPLAKPADAPPPHFRVVRLHAPYGTRKQRGMAAKSGTQPVIPAFEDTPSGDRFLSGMVNVEAPETRGPDDTTRTFAAMWEYNYVQGGAIDTLAVVPTGQTPAPALLDRRHAPLVAPLGAVTGAVTVSPRLDTGRPPFPRLSVDARAALVWSLLGSIPFVGGFLVRLLAGPVLDATLNRADRSVAVPNLTDPDFIDYATAYRPNYLSTGIIR